MIMPSTSACDHVQITLSAYLLRAKPRSPSPQPLGYLWIHPSTVQINMPPPEPNSPGLATQDLVIAILYPTHCEHHPSSPSRRVPPT